MIAVDPHKASNTAAVLDPVTKTLIESDRFANTMDGYVQLTASPAGGPGGAGRWKAAMGRHARAVFVVNDLVAWLIEQLAGVARRPILLAPSPEQYG
jgi:hypothetical protein